MLCKNEVLAGAPVGEFAADLKVIQNWFFTADQVRTRLGSMMKIVETAARVVGFASNGRLGVVTTSDFIDEDIDPAKGVALYEAVLILFRNVVEHSSIETGQQVEVQYAPSVADHRQLTLKNRVASDAACAQCLERAQRSISAPTDSRALDRAPGGTGLKRIRALLIQVYGRPVEIGVDRGDEGASFVTRIMF